ncbi:MAG: Mur ligase family protein [Vicinamibacterales bacterium]
MSHVDYLRSLEYLGIKLGLDQIRRLVAALDQPDRAGPAIIVAGTNGKGSVAAMVERGLRAAGHRTGRYTSPHLVRLNERFAIDGSPIDDAWLERAAGRVRHAARHLPAPPSFFEATTALALDVFREAAVDVSVLEVGLGGRLDATNVVAAAAVAITAVDFDHEQFLGDTLPAIAAEKAGVIKPGCVVVLGENPPEVRDVVVEACRRVSAPLSLATEVEARDVAFEDGHVRATLASPVRTYGPLTLGLAGRHQWPNARVAVRMLEVVDAAGLLPVPASAVRTGVEDVVWAGRLQTIEGPHGPLLIDGAHNPGGAATLAAHVLETFGRRLPIVTGIMADKAIDRMLAALAPAAAAFVCTAARSPRAARPADLLAHARRVAPEVPAEAVADPHAAIARAAALGSPVVVAGSLYLAGDVLADLS